jgi:hypothetical protein
MEKNKTTNPAALTAGLSIKVLCHTNSAVMQ